MAAITDLATLAHTDLAVGDWLVVHDLSAATDKKMAPFAAGTWTPALNFGGATTGITYGTRTGSYVRIGSLCFVNCYIALTSKGSASGEAKIGGLPFTVATLSTFMPARWTNLTTAYVSMVGFAVGGAAELGLRAATAATTSLNAAPAAADFDNTTTIHMSGVYQVA